MHWAQRKLWSCIKLGFKLWAGDLTSVSLSLSTSTIGIIIVEPHNYYNFHYNHTLYTYNYNKYITYNDNFILLRKYNSTNHY